MYILLYSTILKFSAQPTKVNYAQCEMKSTKVRNPRRIHIREKTSIAHKSARVRIARKMYAHTVYPTKMADFSAVSKKLQRNSFKKNATFKTMSTYIALIVAGTLFVVPD